MISFGKNLISDKSAKYIKKLNKYGLKVKYLLGLKKHIENIFKIYLKYGGFSGKLREYSRKYVKKLSKSRLNKNYAITRNVASPSSGATVIAIVGIDGSGKTTISKNLEDWLSWKLDAERHYLGKSRNSCFKSRSITRIFEIISSPYKLWQRDHVRAFNRLLNSYDLKLRLIKIHRLRNRGVTVITDRYPRDPDLDSEYGGPKINKILGENSIMWEKLYNIERESFDLAQELHPDIVIKLNTPPEVAKERDDTPMENLQEKYKIYKNREFPDSVMIEIDTDQPLDDVVEECKSAIWKEI